MTNEASYQDALDKLNGALYRYKADPAFEQHSSDRDQVLDRYGKVFSRENLPDLIEEDFRSFLLIENNHHWEGIHRHGSKLCADMDYLQQELSSFIYGDNPIADRFDQALAKLRGFGKATATPILLVARPDDYGIWNSVSEEFLKRLGVWPNFQRGAKPGEKYAQINQVLTRLRDDLEIDFWTLDNLWWWLDENEPEKAEKYTSLSMGDNQSFGIERHLHDFLRDNWDKTELGQEWVLYSEPEDQEAGYEYPTGVGRIDLLARHRERPEWLIIELKRNQSTDETVGQVLRYIGWIKRNLAQKDEKVKGLIIAHDPTDALLYALDAIAELDVELQRYEVEFKLNTVALDMD